MNHLLCFICTLTLQPIVLAPLFAAEPPSSPLVRVVLDSDFRPEAEFRIAEALRRPPLDWSMIPAPATTDTPPRVSNAKLMAEILAAWDELWKNNPLHSGGVDVLTLHGNDSWIELACSQALAEEALASADDRPSHDVDLTQLPQVHTGEALMAELTHQADPFPLDPYGYDEYNQYFEPEIYDWFVFTTDDLSVVYVHEVSDLGPTDLQVAESFDTPHFDLEVAARLATELAAEKKVPEAFQVFVREQVRTIASGEVPWRSLTEQVVARTNEISRPIWDRYVRKSDLFRSYRIADLPDLLRF